MQRPVCPLHHYVPRMSWTQATTTPRRMVRLSDSAKVLSLLCVVCLGKTAETPCGMACFCCSPVRSMVRYVTTLQG